MLSFSTPTSVNRHSTGREAPRTETSACSTIHGKKRSAYSEVLHDPGVAFGWDELPYQSVACIRRLNHETDVGILNSAQDNSGFAGLIDFKNHGNSAGCITRHEQGPAVRRPTPSSHRH